MLEGPPKKQTPKLPSALHQAAMHRAEAAEVGLSGLVFLR